jgi:leucyl-tRNA synthetase
MKVMQGYNVLHPMGFDAFGLPAENEAIKRKTHPAPMIRGYAETYKRQMELIGVSYDWSRSFISSDPEYYRWTQWIFERLYKRGLVYRKLAAVNWDPVDKTVLADEEVIAGRAERSGALVEKKYIPQWFFRITEYAERLIDDLETIDWPEGIKTQQRNWIGRSVGVQFTMTVDGTEPDPEADNRYNLDSDAPGRRPETLKFDVFTTRIDTVFGMTFCVLAPEHPLVDKILALVDPVHVEAVRDYQLQARTLSDADRQSTVREKTGVFTGAFAINPLNGEKVQIWIADYVLATYGTGAIMAVPAHDDRDFEFAQKFEIPIRQVIAPADRSPVELPFVSKDGVLVNSGEYSGRTVSEAQQALGIWVEGLGIGERKTQYKLRDWLISRQRYWGCPMPVIHSHDGEMQLVPEDCLPVELPMVEHYEPTGDGTSPLAHIEQFVNTTDLDGKLGQRETDTMGGFACSSWYFLRFCDPHNFQMAWDIEKAKYWMPVDCYVGGAEHAVMHLLYARFWTKVLYDEGLVSVIEPFATLHNQGQVLAQTPYRKPHADERLSVGEEGVLLSFKEAETYPNKDDIFYRWARMSKSKGNVVTPEEAVELYGADALRMYLLFRAPFEADIEWENKGMSDLGRFLSRVFRFVDDQRRHYVPEWKDLIAFEDLDERSRKIRRATHQAVKAITRDIDRFGFNTYVSGLMKLLNALNDQAGDGDRGYALAMSEALEGLVLMLSPGAPHSADELWESLGHTGFTFDAAWPVFDEALAAEETVTIAVQVNGKLRDTFEASASASQQELESEALALPKILTHIEGKTIKKVVVVAGKLVNIVAV